MPELLNQRPTQRQIAAATGVSVTTVSRILNPDETNPERWASAKTIAMIQQAAADLGYRRNALAVSLRTSRSQTIGIMLPETGAFPMTMIQTGIEEVAREHGMIPLMTCTPEEPKLRWERTFAMVDHIVAGMIFGDTGVDEELLNSVASQRIPFTLVHRQHENYVSVGANDFLAGELAARHLISVGRQRLALINSPSLATKGNERAQGFIKAVTEAGLPTPITIEAAADVEGGRAAARALFAQPPYPDAIFAMHDLTALGAMGILRQQMIRVPDDVAVIGFYDSPMSLASDLTSVHVDLKQMGRRSCELLLDRLSGKPVHSEVLPVSLAVRNSTKG